MMSKTTALICLLFIPLFVSGLISQNKDTLACDSIGRVLIDDIPDVFSESDTLYLHLANKCDSILYYSVSMEEKLGDEWVLILPDIFKHRIDKHKARNLRVLLPMEDKLIEKPFSDILNLIIKPYGLCRLCYIIKETPFRDVEKLYSTEFLVE
ncbi:hypothetical protein D0T53_03590 [Dysgonomonas sp. 216]|uniref:hypothetical protein n=1 Tax=Dysgonomonas sp. 216 TaxID=2302934 RepID=UPI0013D3D667|nr:hypothetical protein [Dysgonomonas sp. 216]NDW17998.1 hypothetical protein [Dysgonomonas sp. 216]